MRALPSCEITVKNYRGFSDQSPLYLSLSSEFTALVGPNNSGKSTAVRLFYELRNVFDSLKAGWAMESLVRPEPVDFEPLGVEDAAELLHDRNNRDLEIVFDFPEAAENQIGRVVITILRVKPRKFRASLFLGGESRRITGLNFTPGKINITYEGGSLTTPDFDNVFSFFGALSNTLYIGPFRNALGMGAGTYYDLHLGSNFIKIWDEWKNGHLRSRTQAVQRVLDDLRNIFGFSQLDINAAATKTDLQAAVDGRSYRLREMGAGLSQFLVVFASAAFNKPSLLLVDEPELNLHPALQADFLTSLASYAENGILFATHSLGLARTMAESIYSFQRSEHGFVSRLIEDTPEFAEFAGEMSFSAFKEMGHDTILLVEGIHEIKTIQQLLRLLKKDHRIVMIPLGGSQYITGGRQQELAELKRLTDNVAVLIDSEKPSASAAMDRKREEFIKDCRALGFNTHVTERRAFENYLSEDAVRAVKGQLYRALQPFELLRDAVPAWGKHENWRIAREMSRADVLVTDVGRFLDNI